MAEEPGGRIESGDVSIVARDLPAPSPLAMEILNARPYAYLDDAPLEERRARAVQMRRTIGPDAGAVSALDPAAIAEVVAESWPAVRDAEELHDALLTLVVLAPVQGWEEFFAALRDTGRATVLSAGGRHAHRRASTAVGLGCRRTPAAADAPRAARTRPIDAPRRVRRAIGMSTKRSSSAAQPTAGLAGHRATPRRLAGVARRRRRGAPPGSRPKAW
jgi:ATP-dependent Lhr-like helicase